MEDTGSLILSEFAGAAHELFDGLIVNPYDSDEVAATISEALSQGTDRARGRMRLMRERVLRFDARYWAKSFIDDLRAREMVPHETFGGERALREIHDRVVTMNGRMGLCVDYDGTLREIESKPSDAAPTKELRALFDEFVQCANLDVILVSGRPRRELVNWFGGYRFTLVCESGLAFRPPGSSEWTPIASDLDLSWKEEIIGTLRHFEQSTPGSRLEEKESALVWHFRRSDPEFGRWKARQLVGELGEAASNLPIEVHHGKAIVEVTPIQVSKGRAIERITHGKGYGLLLCAGDDVSDESAFTCHAESPLLSVKVGPGPTAARYRVPNPAACRALLKTVVQACAMPTLNRAQS
jgi:trehalose 6-phosphate synthase/phosphatase